MNKQKELWFNTFWKEYPKKVGKKQCKIHWDKLNLTAELFEQIMEGLIDQNVLRAKLELKQVWQPNPSDPIRWLKYERWEDDLSVMEDDKEIKVYQPPKYKNYDER
tara:strand:+ start:579 stop:896 length:318 start_codon:yes stop_codon:yes gene_type:complete